MVYDARGSPMEPRSASGWRSAGAVAGRRPASLLRAALAVFTPASRRAALFPSGLVLRVTAAGLLLNFAAIR